ncbi:MAG TPA: GtrA family protein [Bacteroidaceae bacterium]|nr:GtrA family protein [Bacteroidaceae bacterium]
MINFNLIIKLLKFSLVGFSGMIVDFSATWVLKEKIRINKFIANSIGFILAATSNFIWNRIWTFSGTEGEVGRQYLSFILISVIGLILNNTFLYLFNVKLKQNFYLSKLIAIGFVTLWNFFMNYLFTF